MFWQLKNIHAIYKPQCMYLHVQENKIDPSVKRRPQKKCLILNNMIIWKYQFVNYIKKIPLTDIDKVAISSFWKLDWFHF